MRNKEKTEIECTGCTHRPIMCLLKYNTDLIDKCPCTDCLVKIMCNSICEERRHLYLDLKKEQKEQLVQMNSKNETIRK